MVPAGDWPGPIIVNGYMASAGDWPGPIIDNGRTGHTVALGPLGPAALGRESPTGPRRDTHTWHFRGLPRAILWALANHWGTGDAVALAGSGPADPQSVISQARLWASQATPMPTQSASPHVGELKWLKVPYPRSGF